MANPCTVTLTISGITPLAIAMEVDSSMDFVTWIKQGNPTSRGVSTLEGVTARSPLIMMAIKATLWNYDLLSLYTIRDTQDARIGLATGIITVANRWRPLTAVQAALEGRSTISTETVNGVTGHYCNFYGRIETIQVVKEYQNNLGLNGRTAIAMVIKEL